MTAQHRTAAPSTSPLRAGRADLADRSAGLVAWHSRRRPGPGQARPRRCSLLV